MDTLDTSRTGSDTDEVTAPTAPLSSISSSAGKPFFIFLAWFVIGFLALGASLGAFGGGFIQNILAPIVAIAALPALYFGFVMWNKRFKG